MIWLRRVLILVGALTLIGLAGLVLFVLALVGLARDQSRDWLTDADEGADYPTGIG